MIGDGDPSNNGAFQGCFWLVIAAIVLFILFTYTMTTISK